MFDAFRFDRDHLLEVMRISALLDESMRSGPTWVRTKRVNERNGAPIYERLVNRGTGAGTDRAIAREQAAERARQAQYARLQMQEAA